MHGWAWLGQKLGTYISYSLSCCKWPAVAHSLLRRMLHLRSEFETCERSGTTATPALQTHTERFATFRDSGARQHRVHGGSKHLRSALRNLPTRTEKAWFNIGWQ